MASAGHLLGSGAFKMVVAGACTLLACAPTEEQVGPVGGGPAAGGMTGTAGSGAVGVGGATASGGMGGKAVTTSSSGMRGLGTGGLGAGGLGGSGGQCFNQLNNTPCDDGNTCTTGDTCLNGVCAGTPSICNPPAAAQCVNATTLRTYAATPCGSDGCTPTYTDTVCNGGCVNGACVACTTATEIVDIGTSLDVSNGVPLVLGSTGRLHVAYYRANGNQLLHAQRDSGGQWVSDVVDGSINTGNTIAALAVDAADTVHVGYGTPNPTALMRAERPLAAASWSYTTVTANQLWPWDMSMVIGPAGQFSL